MPRDPKATAQRSRTAYLWGETLRYLVAQGGQASRRSVREHLQSTQSFSPHELQPYPDGELRWWRYLEFNGIGLDKAGHVRRSKGVWSITPEGVTALNSMTDLELLDDIDEKYKLWAAENLATRDDEDSDQESTDRGRRIWLIGTGSQGVEWATFRNESRIAISFVYEGKGLGDLSQMTLDQIRERLVTLSGKPNPNNNVLCAWEFAHEMRDGDLVIARSGRSRMLGVGIIRGPYSHNAAGGTYPHMRPVQWLSTEERSLPSGYMHATKTLTEITRYTGYVDVIFGRRTPAAEASLKTTNISREDIDAHFSQPPYPGIDDGTAPSGPAHTPAGDAPSLEVIDSESFLAMDQLKEIITTLRIKKAIVLQGSPGTGKSFLADRLAHHHCGDRSRVVKVQFHPSYGYEDFVRGIRPVEGGGFRVEDGPLIEIAERAKASPHESFALILDEINRANVAKVLGEALSLIEADKRDSRHAVQLGLASSGNKSFWLPPNLAIIATMNTADRSIALVDYALRRRFGFFTLTPAFESPDFKTWLTEQLSGGDGGSETISKSDRREIDRAVEKILSRMRDINQAIREHKALGAHFVIGHSFFCTYDGIDGDSPLRWAERVFKTEIIPLIEEYSVEHPRLRGELLALLKD